MSSPVLCFIVMAFGAVTAILSICGIFPKETATQSLVFSGTLIVAPLVVLARDLAIKVFGMDFKSNEKRSLPDLIKTLNETMLVASQEKGKEYKNHAAVAKDLTSAVKSYIKSNSEIEIRIINVAMRYTFEYIEKSNGLKKLVKENPDTKFTLLAAVTHPDYLASLKISNDRDFSWMEWAKSLPGKVEILKQTWRDEGISNFDLQLFHYHALPTHHGFLINGEQLFLGYVDWKWEPKNRPPKLEVGANHYRRFVSWSDTGRRRIIFFRHWFTFYTSYDTVCCRGSQEVKTPLPS